MAKTKQKPTRRAIKRRRTVARRLRKRRETPLGRLTTDGAFSSSNINRRLNWLAGQWGLEAPPKVGHTPSEKLARYCNRHRINYDWMLGGCLKGLKRMMDERRGLERTALSTEALMAKYAQLTPEHQAIFTAEVNRIMAERDQ